jgi:hypothetical protein
MTQWRPIAGRPGYDISDDGQVYSYASDRILKPSIHGKYLGLMLGRGRIYTIHIEILKAFVGPRPEGYEGCHNNGIHTDNRLTNLRWDTKQANKEDNKLHGKDPVGERNPSALLTEQSVVTIRTVRKPDSYYAELFGASRRAIREARQGNTWKHLHVTPYSMGSGKRIAS